MKVSRRTREVLVPLLLLLGTLHRRASSQRPYDFGDSLPRLLQSRQQQGQGQEQGDGGGSVAQNLVVTPLPLINGLPGMRMEIRDMRNNDPDCFELLVLALSMMQWDNQTNELSWYQIAGIHFLPAQPWAEVMPVEGNERLGYGMHSSILFCNWHRPYVALFEQTIWNWAQAIASMYPAETRSRFQQAAYRLRLPYWDWAKSPPPGEDTLPSFMADSPEMDADGPYGVQRIANPFYRYVFHPLDSAAFDNLHPYSKWGDTKRTDSDSDDATSNNRMIARALNNARPSLAQRLFNLFSLSHNFSSFSHDAWIPQDIEAGTQAGYDSLENVHDVVHTLVGGGRGHMSHVAVAAFDPIFFWHHVNIDRLFSMWQVLNPDSWVPPTPAVLPSFTTRRGDVQTGQTPLTPFFIDNSGANFWTADSARDPLVFGYTYPELSGVPLAERSSRVRSQVIESINANYGTFSPSRLSNTSPRRTTAASESPRTRQSGEEQPEPVAGMEAEARRRNVASRSARTGNEHQLSDRALGMVGIAWTGKGGGRQPTRKSVLFDDDDDDSGSSGGSSSGSARVVRPKNSIAYREWAINVVADKSALGGPFTIFFFVGEPPSIPSPDSRPMSDRAFAALTDAPNLVGNFAAFTMSGSQMDVINRATEIATNATSRRQQVSGSVPLTWALMRLVTDPPASSKASGLERLASLREGHVRPFLRRHLTFRVLRTTDGVVVDPAAAVGMEAGGGGGGPDRERSGQQAWLTISVVGWVVRPPRDAQLELPRWGKMVDRWDLY